MKRTVIASVIGGVACLAAALSSYGQGQVFFANYASDVNAQVAYSSDTAVVPAGKAGMAIGGNTWMADLLYGIGSDPVTSLAAGSATAFLGSADGDTANGAGYFVGNAVTIPGYSSGPISFIVRAWSTSGATGGADYDTSLLRGESAVLTMPSIATGTMPVGDLVGLQAFTVEIVPEPTTLALVGLGAAALLAFRRRK